MSNVAVIFRGVPGSGKSTITRTLADACAKKNLSCSVHSADDKCIVDGVYTFNPNNLNRNHSMTENEFRQSLANQVNVVICDNTNCRVPNYRAYVDHAKEAGYEVVFLCLVPSSVQEHMSRNIHNVPEDTLVKMRNTLLANWEFPKEVTEYFYEIQPEIFSKPNGVDSLVDSVLHLVR